MDRKLKALFLIDEYLPNISQAIRTVDNYATYLSSYWSVTVATLQDTVIGKEVDYRMISAKNKKDLKYILLSERYDIVYVHSSSLLAIAKLIADKNNVPVVTTLHTNELANIVKRNKIKMFAKKEIARYIRILNFMDEVFVSSPFVAEDLRENGFVGKVSYLPLGSDLDTDTRKTKLLEVANNEYNLKDCKNVLVSVGNVRKTKRFDFVLKALKVVKDRGVDFKYFVVGPGEEIGSLQSLAKKLEISDNVSFLGKTQDYKMSALLARADVLLYPSTYDYYGMAKIESAGFGTAGIYIQDSFVSSEVFDQINGYVSNNSIIDYAETIVNVLSNKTQLKKVGSNAYNDLYITWDQCSERLKSRIEGIIIEQNKLSRRLKK